MGVPASGSSNKPQADAENGSVEVEVEETTRAATVATGAAQVFLTGASFVLKVFFLMVAGVCFGIGLALILQTVLPQLTTSLEESEKPEAAHLHVVSTNLTKDCACALEALASTHKNRTCHVVLLQHHSPQVIQMVTHLSNHHPNLRMHLHPDVDEYFEGSPLEGFGAPGVSSDMLELAGRALALWRHGGASVDLRRPVLELPSAGEVMHRSAGAVMQFPEPCHPALQGLLATLGHDKGSSAVDAMQRATKWMCRPPTGAKDPFAPEHCLGVQVIRTQVQSNDALHCPLVRKLNREVNQNQKQKIEKMN